VNWKRMARALVLPALLIVSLGMPALGQGPMSPPQKGSGAPGLSAPTGLSQAIPAPFDVKAATDAYLATVPSDKKARSDAYFEGGYWLILWDFLMVAAIYFFFLQSGLSARLRDLAQRLTRHKPLQTICYFVPFSLVAALLGFPLTVYEGYIREHQYGLATQTFGPWFRDQAVNLAVSLVFGTMLITMLFVIVQRLGRTWWVGGAGVTIVFFCFGALLGPVYFAPLFNTYTKLKASPVRDSILSMARANGIPATEVYEMDASRQSTRVSANVSGFLGTERITLNDNWLKRCTPAEVQAVMGHEMGHYVLNHVYKGLFYIAVVTVVAFAALDRMAQWAIARWGQRWGVRGITDVAVIPLAGLLISVFSFLYTPIENTFIRTQEYEADIFGLNAARQPDGEAEVDLKLGEYRKLDPGPLEEFIFFDHPSGRTRITAAMHWKAEHLVELQPAGERPASPSPVPPLPQL
jgi:STE24 endopeptidase